MTIKLTSDVRAALETLGEPDEAMLQAGAEADAEGSEETFATCGRRC